MACEDDVNGSGAASFEVFYPDISLLYAEIASLTYSLAFLTYHGGGRRVRWV